MCVCVYIFPTQVKSYILLQDRKMGFIFATVTGSRQSGILECWQCFLELNFVLLNVHGSIVDLQCCVSFCCIAKSFSYIHTYIHSF